MAAAAAMSGSAAPSSRSVAPRWPITRPKCQSFGLGSAACAARRSAPVKLVGPPRDHGAKSRLFSDLPVHVGAAEIRRERRIGEDSTAEQLGRGIDAEAPPK
jgi:hypothetical protein